MPSEKEIDNYIDKMDEENVIYVEKELEYAEKCHNLEQELGCPLDVIFRALKDGIYIEDNIFNTFEKYDVRGIELIGLSVINKICNYGECDFTCYYDDYKKTWWLREDKSE